MKKFILKLTYRIWHPVVNKILLRAKQEGVISDRQLHLLCATLDRTQKYHCLIYKV